jgi:hypothetical protein
MSTAPAAMKTSAAAAGQGKALGIRSSTLGAAVAAPFVLRFPFGRAAFVAIVKKDYAKFSK